MLMAPIITQAFIDGELLDAMLADLSLRLGGVARTFQPPETCGQPQTWLNTTSRRCDSHPITDWAPTLGAHQHPPGRNPRACRAGRDGFRPRDAEVLVVAMGVWILIRIAQKNAVQWTGRALPEHQ